MGDDDASDDRDLPAGVFSSWMLEIQGAIRGGRDAEVPCDGCTACCTSSQFVHIGPDETDTLEHIPPELVFPAPRMPGHVLLGYDERGHCPMLVDGACSIYDHRPRTCRTYDCRVFAATDITLVDPDKARVDRQARRWKFDFPTPADRDLRNAVRAAANFLAQPVGPLPDGPAPANETQRAVRAIEMHESFL